MENLTAALSAQVLKEVIVQNVIFQANLLLVVIKTLFKLLLALEDLVTKQGISILEAVNWQRFRKDEDVVELLLNFEANLVKKLRIFFDKL